MFGPILVLLIATQYSFAQKYPADAGIIDITKSPYNADKTGVADVTSIINKAFADYPNADRTFYFPEGTYLITNTLKFPGWPQNYHIEGDSIDKTVIKLQDNCTDYTNPGNPKEMINTGLDPAQRFHITIRDLTFNTGTGNTGAIGARFMANNEGGMFDVKIISGDGTGIIGLDLSYVNENGPLLIKNVVVEGYNYGIKSQAQQNSQTFEHITLKNQKVCGFYNAGQVISIRDLTSENSVQVINNAGGTMTLVGASLTAGDAATNAINNNGLMYLRDITSSGYANLVKNNAGNKTDVTTASLVEWTSHNPVGLADTVPGTMLNLEIKETPDATIDSFDQWQKVPPSNGVNDGPAIQAALDSGKSTVYFPYGNYTFWDTVYVRGNVQRIISFGGTINVGWRGTFRVLEGTAPVVVFENFRGTGGTGNFVTQASGRTVVIKTAIEQSVTNLAGTGDLFLENICGGGVFGFKFNGGNVWARQFNVENQGTHITNNGANLWIMGLKTERHGNLIETKNKGKTEILGFFCYTTTAPPSTQAMFVNNESSFSAVGSETTYGTNYKYFLEEIKCGASKKLSSATLPGGGGSGHAVCFLTSTLDTCLNVGIEEETVNPSNLITYPNPATDVMRIRLNSDLRGKVSYTIFNILGSPVYSKLFNMDDASGYDTEINVESFPAGIYILNVVGSQKYINKVFEVK